MRASVPAGKRLDESLQLIYEKVRQNSSMGLEALNFVAQHYNISYDTVQRVCRKYYQEEMLDPSFNLTFPQFLQLMREALGKSGGGDLKHGTADQARDLARSFQIYEATCATPRRGGSAKIKLPSMPPAEIEDLSWGPRPESSVLGLSRGRTPLDTGLVTPRRLKTASFLPTTLNLTASARRTGDSHLLFANGPLRNLTSASGPHGYDMEGTWKSEYMDLGRFYNDGQDLKAAGTFVPLDKFPAHQKFETESSEIGRASRRLSTGQLHEPPVRHPAEPRGTHLATHVFAQKFICSFLTVFVLMRVNSLGQDEK